MSAPDLGVNRAVWDTFADQLVYAADDHGDEEGLAARVAALEFMLGAAWAAMPDEARVACLKAIREEMAGIPEFDHLWPPLAGVLE